MAPRNEHAEFKGILYGLPTRNNATTVLRLKHNCTNIGIEPPIVLTRMTAPSSSSQTEPGCTPKAPPASCVPLDKKKDYIQQIMQAPEEADYDTDNVDKSPLMLPRSANKIGKLRHSQSVPEIGKTSPRRSTGDDYKETMRMIAEEMERQSFIEAAPPNSVYLQFTLESRRH